MSVLIWVKTVCKVYQQMKSPLVSKELKLSIPLATKIVCFVICKDPDQTAMLHTSCFQVNYYASVLKVNSC